MLLVNIKQIPDTGKQGRLVGDTYLLTCKYLCIRLITFEVILDRIRTFLFNDSIRINNALSAMNNNTRPLPCVSGIPDFLLLQTSKTESTDIKNHFNQSKIKQWWIEKHYPTSITIVNDQSQISSSSSFEFCVPFHTCPTNLNRTILVILVSIFILGICFYYNCYEYCMVKHQLDVEKLRRLQQYQYVNNFVHNQGFSI
ncbi:unnamed protein product [Rotaria sordida]|uniref:Uncharacterized protein n=1 Tax=Rotaria sordida TaxID=392033 RepID=A0A819QMN6_9BILA|nr:unnamed protein product [Rotaria sordida]